jgi:hypothetical protein
MPEARRRPDGGFTERDLPLLIDVLNAHQALEATAYAVRLVEAAITYPIEDRRQLERMLYGVEAVQVGTCSITLDQVREQLPENLFPIADRTQLISHFVMALMRGQMKQLEELPLGGESEEVAE